MSKAAWERIGAATGIAFVVALVVVIVVDNSLTHPVVRAGERISSSEAASFAKENYDSLNLIRFLNMAMAGLLIWFAGSVRSAIARTEPDGGRLAALSFGGGLSLGILLLLSAAIGRAINDHTVFGGFGDSSVSALESLGASLNPAMAVPAAIFLGAAGLAAVRFGGLPKWLGWVGLLFALANVIVATSVVWVTSEVSGLEFLDIGMPLTFLWILMTSVVLVVRPTWGKQPTPEPEPQS